jgi:protoporphyrinogen oxidase
LQEEVVPPSKREPKASDIVVIGAGPAGLTAAYALTKRAEPVTVVEADRVVGGISRTVERDGWRFDIGGHRFFTKVPVVEDLWHEILPDEQFLLRPRMSRIYYDGKFFDYPLRAMNALRNLGLLEAVRCVLSYAWARIHPPKDQTNYEGWLVARFGWRLYRHFFKSYTEKVWGMPVAKMPADWAAQRIKNLSLSSAIVNALLPKRNQKDITSLIEEFQYPMLGPGMMWERARDLVVERGGSVVMQAPVAAVRHKDGRATAVVTTSTADGRDGAEVVYPADHVISSMPLPELVLAMDPPAPADVQKAARELSHRDFLTVALVVPLSDGFPDNWIYIHSPEVKVGRIQNFASWSPYLVKDGMTCLGLEYFVFEGDDLWTMPDDALVALGSAELERLGLARAGDVVTGYVVRMPKAYPVYDEGYKQAVDVLRGWIATNVPNVHPVGRNGMHKYNNQDHSMLTALLSVENILDGAGHDVWSVNVDEDYHEEQTRTTRSGSAGGATYGATGRDAPVLPRREAAGAQRPGVLPNEGAA